MLDLDKQMEVNCKVNKMIQKANDELNLGLTQPHITYKLKDTADVAKTVGTTINFNSGLVNIIDEDIQREVAHVINFEVNHESGNSRSETYVNIIKVLKGTADIITNVKKREPAQKKVKTVKPKPKKGNVNKAKAVAVFRDNPGLTRQEMLTKIVEALGFTNDKPGRIKAAGLYQQAKKVVEAGK